MASDKIFVDLDEEIVFTVEKIAQSASDRVIVVVPESANLVASLISLKLLSSQIARSNKLIVMVTEDELGLKLSKKAGIVSKEKISQITPEVWVQAEERKKAFLSERAKLKNKLVSERQETNSYEIVDNEGEEKLMEKEESNKSEKPAEEAKNQEIAPEPVISTSISQKPRLEPKVVNLGNIKVLAGGDIELEHEFHNEVADLPIRENQNELIERKVNETVGSIEIEKKERGSKSEAEGYDKNKESPDKENRENEDEDTKSTEESFTTANLLGKDLSKIVPDNPRRRRMQQQDFSRKREVGGDAVSGDNFFKQIVSRVRQFYITGNTRLKLGGTVVGILVIFFFLTNFVFNGASVTIYTQQQNIQVSKEVTGKIDGDDVEVENLVIPVYPLKISDSSSNTADTTGNVEDGNKAQGLITIYNKTEEEVNLPAGTVLENISTGNKYKLMSATAVPAAVVDGADNLNLGVKKDVSIQAESFGEKYNTSGTANYKFTGFNTDELDARSFGNIEGGDTSEERAVAEGDIADLENGLIDELKNRLLNELRDSVADDEYFLEETVSYGSPESSSDFEVGDQAESVTVSLELEATAYFVKEDELKQIVAEIIKSESDFEGEVDLDALDDINLVNVVAGEEEVTFQIDSKGDITADFTEEEIASELSGKSIGAAKEYLDNREGVEDYNLSVGPFYLPGFLKSMPSEGKIDVEIQKSLSN